MAKEGRHAEHHFALILLSIINNLKPIACRGAAVIGSSGGGGEGTFEVRERRPQFVIRRTRLMRECDAQEMQLAANYNYILLLVCDNCASPDTDGEMECALIILSCILIAFFLILACQCLHR